MPPQMRANPAASYDRAVQAALLETGLPGFKEVLDYTFYDSTDISTGETDSTTLFQTPTNNLATSNFYGQGSMPAGQAFLVRSLRIIPAMQTAAADVGALNRGLLVSFLLENAKKYVEGLAQFFPPGIGLTYEDVAGTVASIAVGLSTANNGVPALNNVYKFTRPVVLRTLQPFQITLRALAPTLVATTRVFVAIDGVFVRNTI